MTNHLVQPHSLYPPKSPWHEAKIRHEEIESCARWLEIHECPECGQPIAHCTIHDDGIKCACGVVL